MYDDLFYRSTTLVEAPCVRCLVLPFNHVNPRRHWAFGHPRRHRGGGVGTTPRRVSPLFELELRDKNQRVGRDERKLKIPEFKGFGHLVTSQVKK